MKKLLALLLVLVMVLSLAACAAKTEPAADAPAEEPAPTETAPAEETKEPEQAEEPAVEEQPVEVAEPVELTVFAAASLTESLTAIAEKFMQENPIVTLSFNFDSSGKLLTQIKEGAACDLFISAAPKQMNALDGALKDDADKNPDGLDMLVEGSRIDLLENKVALAVAAEATADMCAARSSIPPPC